MGKWKIYTPEGVQDTLFEDCFIKRNIESSIRDIFRMQGYLEIETPTMEFYDVFSSESELTPQEMMFKFFDNKGRILVLRPDYTVPAARVMATKLKDMQLPIKLSYIGSIFRYNELGGGNQKEFTEAGVEIMGVSTPEADAEVIVTSINVLKAAGLENFQIDIGQVEFFKGIMEETGLSEQDIEQIRVLIDTKDFFGIEALVKSHKICEELKSLILSLPSLFGSKEVIEKVKKITTNKKSLKALDNLSQVLDILTDYGVGKYISVDLGMVQSLNYYTGVIFKGFTYGVGFPIVKGGRYDGLVEKFGKKCPATGFSVRINMLMTALERQKIIKGKVTIDTIICYSSSGRKTAFDLCNELREQGMKVEIDITNSTLENIKLYAKSKGIGGILNILDSDSIEVYNLETDGLEKTSISALLGR